MCYAAHSILAAIRKGRRGVCCGGLGAWLAVSHLTWGRSDSGTLATCKPQVGFEPQAPGCCFEWVVKGGGESPRHTTSLNNELMGTCMLR